MKKIILIGSALFILVFLFYLCGKQEQPKPTGYRPVEKKEIISKQAQEAVEKAINESIKAGLIRKIDTATNKAWLDYSMWQLCNAEFKETIAKTIATYCAIKKNIEYLHAELYDWQSARKIASYSSLSGFKVY